MYLEKGDYIPFLKFNSFDIHSYCNEKYYLIICVNDINTFNTQINYLNNIRKFFNLIIIYKEGIFNKFNICEMINVGQTWGWEYDDIFVHFELADYLYFLDIILLDYMFLLVIFF